MREILLTQNQIALVDDADYDWLNQWKWFASKDRSGNFYAVRHSSKKKSNGHLIKMSRQILGLKYGDKRQADHRDHNTLDNRQGNIRICTSQQNRFNQKPHRNTTSQFKGVTWDRQTGKWLTAIYINKKRNHIGRFILEEVAALAYDMIAIQEFGEFAYLNFN